MNAALQVLYAMEDITALVRTKGKMYKKGSLAAAYKNLVPQLTHRKRAVHPKTLCTKGWKQLTMKPGTQGDAQEFLGEMLNCLSDKDILWSTAKNAATPVSLKKLYTIPVASRLLEVSSSTHMPRKEPTSYLTLPVHTGDTTLEQCIAGYFAPELEKVRDPKTDKLVDTPRKRFLEGTPQYLILALNRTTYQYNQKTKQVHLTRHSNPLSFPLEGLSLKNYFEDTSKDQGPYELIGIIMHGGSATGGHYTSYVKAGNLWYYCNDTHIQSITQNQMHALAQRDCRTSSRTVPTTFVYKRSSQKRF